MSYELTKNDPAPPARKVNYRWPFADMEPDHSFAVHERAAWPSACNAAYAYGRRHGVKFAVRWNAKAVSDSGNPEPHGKIWRVS